MDSNVQFRENQGWHSATHFLIMKSLSAADSPPIELTRRIALVKPSPARTATGISSISSIGEWFNGRNASAT